MTRAEVVCRVAVSLTKSNPHQYYFAESLIDLQKAEGGKVAPIGIVNTAIGGTMICDWTGEHDRLQTRLCAWLLAVGCWLFPDGAMRCVAQTT